MSLFQDIQESVLDEDKSLASVLLKLKLLASHLGSEPLAAWVRQELEGYETDEVPPYRTANAAYRGTFSGPFGSGVKNAPIPPALIYKIAGEDFTRCKIRDSISAISKLALTKDFLRIDGANLVLLLQGKVYPDFTCNEVFGTISTTDLVRIIDAVRSKILDFTIEIEKQHPDIREVDLIRRVPESGGVVTANANRLVQQTFYANTLTNSVFAFEHDLERILVDRVRRSDSDDGEKDRMVDSIKSAGIQEVVKQIVRKTTDFFPLLSTLGQ